MYSPDKKLEIKVEKQPDGSYWYSFSANKKLLISESPIGFETVKSGKVPSTGWTVTAQYRKTVNSVWKPVWGKRQLVSDRYNELTLKLSSADNKMNLVLRAYNEGVAFRYLMPQESKAEQEVLSELTGFNFAGDFTAWYYNFEWHNVGPELLSQTDGDRMPMETECR